MIRLSAHIPWRTAGVSEWGNVSLNADHISWHPKGHAERNLAILYKRVYSSISILLYTLLLRMCKFLQQNTKQLSMKT